MKKNVLAKKIIKKLFAVAFLFLIPSLIITHALAEETAKDKACSSKLFGTVSGKTCEEACPKAGAKCFKTHEYPSKAPGGEKLECYTCARDNQCSDIGAMDWWGCLACDFNPATECIPAGMTLPFGGGPFGGKTWAGVQCYQCVPKPDRCSDVFLGTSWLASCQATCVAPNQCVFAGIHQGNDCYKCQPTSDTCMDMWAFTKDECKKHCENQPNRKCVAIGMTSKFEPCFDCVKIKPEPPPPPPKGCKEIGLADNCDACLKQKMGCLPTQAPNGQACYQCTARSENHCPPPSLNKWECPICEERGGECIGRTRTKDDPDCYDCHYNNREEFSDCAYYHQMWDSCTPNPCYENQTCAMVQVDKDLQCAQCQDIKGYHQGGRCEKEGKLTTCNECYKKKQACRSVQVPEINEWCYECFSPAQSTSVCTSNEQAFYKTVTDGDLKSEVAVVVKEDCHGGCVAKEGDTGAHTTLEVSILSRSPGVDGRNWVPEKPIIQVGKEKIHPTKKDFYYVEHKSIAKNAAVAIFTALGTQYERVAKEASESEGKVCPVTGKKLGGGSEDLGQSKLEKGIDRAGMAAGLGLLTSQAKGQITGLRSTFCVPQAMDAVKLTADVVNQTTGERQLINIPIIGALFKSADAKQDKELNTMITPTIVHDGKE